MAKKDKISGFLKPIFNLGSICEKHINESAGLLPNKSPKLVYLLTEASRY